MTLKRVEQGVIIVVLLATPIFSIMEVVALFRGQITSQAQNLTPTFVKLAKDFAFGLMFLLGTFQMFARGKVLKAWELAAIIILGAFSAGISLAPGKLLLILAGVRWLFPIILVLFVSDAVDEELLRGIAKVLAFLFVVAFALQVLELFFAGAWYGRNKLGLSKRCTGFFLIPNTMAGFVLFCYYFFERYLPNSRKRKMLLVLVTISVIITGSGTGVFSLLGIYYLKFYYGARSDSSKGLVITLALFISAAVVVYLPVLTGRPDIYMSLAARFEILNNKSDISFLVASGSFGDATNSGVLLTNQMKIQNSTAIIADSMFTSLIGNTGLLSCLIYILYIIRRLGARFRREYLFIIPFLFFLMTTILSEVFPMNLLSAIWLASVGKEMDCKRQIVST